MPLPQVMNEEGRIYVESARDWNSLCIDNTSACRIVLIRIPLQEFEPENKDLIG
jgi:hypothetical protein